MGAKSAGTLGIKQHSPALGMEKTPGSAWEMFSRPAPPPALQTPSWGPRPAAENEPPSGSAEGPAVTLLPEPGASGPEVTQMNWLAEGGSCHSGINLEVPAQDGGAAGCP